MLGKLLLVFFSLSIRTPYITPNPLDYEVKGGIETEDCRLSALSERENGSNYIGIDYLHNLPIDIEIENKKIKPVLYWYVKEAVGIDVQGIKLLRDMKYYSAGLSINSNGWEDTRALLSFVGRLPMATIEIDTNFTDRHITLIKFSKRFAIDESGKVYFKPLMVYRYVDEVEFIQFKVEIGVKL